MLAIREIHPVTSDSILVRLPANFSAKQVEVIILPMEEETISRRQRLQVLLLASPVSSEDDLKQYEAVEGWMNQWQPPSF